MASMSTTAPTTADGPFLWTYTEEPHRSRRLAIIKAHPEVLKLCGPEPLTKYLIAGVVSLQIVTACLLRNTHPLSWLFFGTAYVIGATANQNLFLGIHELSHNLVFKAGWLNRLYAVFANLPIALPYTAVFRPYHLTHHKSMGVHGLDSDIPTAVEAFLLNSFLGKVFFCTFQIFFYAVRPMFIYQQPLSQLQLFNLTVQLLFNYGLVKFVGWNALIYLAMSSVLSGSLHPCAGHFIAEHYVFSFTNGKAKKGPHDPTVPLPETYSYYGYLNALTYNVGYHNEHHDFPAIPWSRLPTLHRIAHEFYKDLPSHSCWMNVIWQFMMDDGIGLWCRVKRMEGGRKVGAGTSTTATTCAWKEDELDANDGNSKSK